MPLGPLSGEVFQACPSFQLDHKTDPGHARDFLAGVEELQVVAVMANKITQSHIFFSLDLTVNQMQQQQQQKKEVFLLCGYHLKEHCSSDSHPLQLDLKGSFQRKVAMVVATAPLSSVTAVIDIHVQRDCLLLWDCSSWRTDGQRWGGGKGGDEKQ